SDEDIIQTMPFLIAILTFLFLLSAFITNPPSSPHSLLVLYASMQLDFIRNNTIVFLLLYLIFAGFSFRSLKDMHSFLKKLFFLTFQFFEALFVSVFFALALLFVVGVIEVNIFATLLSIQPGYVGVSSNVSTITKTLQNT